MFQLVSVGVFREREDVTRRVFYWLPSLLWFCFIHKLRWIQSFNCFNGKSAGLGHSAKTSICLLHLHACNSDLALNMKFPLEFPQGPFFTCWLPGSCFGSARAQTAAGVFSLHTSCSIWKREERTAPVSLYLRPKGALDCLFGWGVKTGSDGFTPPTWYIPSISMRQNP